MRFHFEVSAVPHTPLLGYITGRMNFPVNQIRGVLRSNETTQIDVVVGRVSKSEIFRFFGGDGATCDVEPGR